MKKRIFIHVGYPKTGTTSLQQHVFPIINELQYLGKHDNEEGLFDFEAELVNDLIFKKNMEIDFVKLRQSLLKDKKGIPLLISEESFLSNSLRVSRFKNSDVLPEPKEIAKNINSLFTPEDFDVNILFTIRRQDEMITSLYAQSYLHYYSKDKKVNTFKKFLGVFLNEKSEYPTFQSTLNYLETISFFQDVFGSNSVSVLVFEEMSSNPKVFYTKLFEFLNLNIVDYHSLITNKNENKRTSGKGYKQTKSLTLFDFLVSAKHRFLPSLKVGLLRRYKEKLKLVTLKSNKNMSKTIYLTDEEKKQILIEYSLANKELDNMYDLNLAKYGYFDD